MIARAVAKSSRCNTSSGVRPGWSFHRVRSRTRVARTAVGAARPCTARERGSGYAACEYSLISPSRIVLRRTARAENLIRPGRGQFDHRNEIRCVYKLSGPNAAGIHANSCARMIRCAASTGLPRRDQHARAAAAAADERPGQGRRDPRAAAPDHGPRTATARREGPVHPGRPGLARRPAAPATPRRTAQPAAAGPPGDRAALAPRPDRPPARPDLPAHARSGGHEPSGRSAGWCCAWPARTAPGDTAVSTANCSSWGSRSPPPPSGRSSRTPAIDPAPERTSSTWATFLRSQAHAIIAADFFETTTLTGATTVRPGGHRARHPPGPDPRRHRPPDRGLGDPGRPEPGHGPRRRRLPGQVPDPGPGRQVPGPVRRDPRRRRDQRRAQRRPDAPHELDHGTVDPSPAATNCSTGP